MELQWLLAANRSERVERGSRLKEEHTDREKDSNQIMKKIDRVIIKENAIKPNLVWLIGNVGTGKPP